MANLSSGGLGMGITFTLKDSFTNVAKKIKASQSGLNVSTKSLASGVKKSIQTIQNQYTGLKMSAKSMSVGLGLSLNPNLIRGSVSRIKNQFKSLTKSALSTSVGLSAPFNRITLNKFRVNINKAINATKRKFTELRMSVRMASKDINNTLKEIGATKIAGASFVASLGIGAAINEAAKLSDQLANVQKTTGLTDKELQTLFSTVKKFDTRTSIKDLLDIGTVGGRLGVPKAELEGFIQTVDKAVVALGDDFSGGSEQIATELGKIKTLFADTSGLKFDVALNKIGSALNELGNSGANSAPNVADFTKRIGQLGKLAPSISQTMGIGATLEEVGIRSEIAAGGLTNLMLVAGENSKKFAKHLNITTKEFNNMLNSSPNDLILAIAKSFEGVPSSQLVPTLKDLKVGTQESIKVVSSLANNLDLLGKRQALAARAMKEGVSLTNEFNIKNKTLQATIDKAKKRLIILAQSIGVAVAPMFTLVTNVIVSLIDILSGFIQTPVGRFLTQLTTVLVIGAAAWATYTLTIAPAIKALSKVKTAAVNSAKALRGLAIASGVFVGLVAIVYKAIDAFDNFEGQVSKLSGFKLFLTQLGGVVRGIMAVVTSWDNVSETFLLSKGLAGKLKSLGILDFVVNLGTWIVRIIEFTKGMFAGLSSGFTFVYNVITGLLSPLVWLGGIFLKLIGGIDNAESAVRSWAKAGKIAGYVLVGVITVLATIWIAKFILMGITAFIAVMPVLISIVTVLATIIVAVVTTAVIWIAQFILMGIAALVAMAPIIIIITLIGLAIYAVIKIAQWLISKFVELWGYAKGWVNFGVNMVKNIWDGVKSMWGQFTSWITGAMADIPLVGRFFMDDEGIQEGDIGGNNTPTVGDAVARQQGIVNAPASPVNQQNQPINQQPQSIQLFLEGDQLTTVINDRNQLQQARE